MKLKKTITAIAALGAISFGGMTASANTPAVGTLGTTSGLSITQGCTTCHTGASTTALGSSGSARNAFGTAFKATSNKTNNYAITTAQWDALKVLDSDGDGATNLKEITDGTNPGVDPNASSGNTSSGSSGGGCMTAELTTPLMMVLGMLTLGFFVRRKKS